MSNFTTGEHPNVDIHLLDHSDLKTLLTVGEHLYDSSFSLLEKIDYRLENIDRYRIEALYEEKSTLIAMSDSAMRHPFCFCGIRNRVNRGGRCNIPRWCSYCNYKQYVQPNQRMYLPAFHRARWYEVCVSYGSERVAPVPWYSPDNTEWAEEQESLRGGYLPLEPYYADEILAHWSATDRAMYALCKVKGIRGAVGKRDIALRFLPVRCVFHTHWFLDANEFGEEEVAALEAGIREYLRSDRIRRKGLNQPLRWNLEPSVWFREITSKKHLKSAISYALKTYRIALPYLNALPDARDRGRMLELNQERNLALDCITELCYGEDGLFKFGTLAPNAKRKFIGVPCPKAAKRRQRKQAKQNPYEDEV
jgi:hypothetical protein